MRMARALPGGEQACPGDGVQPGGRDKAGSRHACPHALSAPGSSRRPQTTATPSPMSSTCPRLGTQVDAAVQARDQVGDRHVEEAGGRESPAHRAAGAAPSPARNRRPRRRRPTSGSVSRLQRQRAPRATMPPCSRTAKLPTSCGTSCATPRAPSRRRGAGRSGMRRRSARRRARCGRCRRRGSARRGAAVARLVAR